VFSSLVISFYRRRRNARPSTDGRPQRVQAREADGAASTLSLPPGYSVVPGLSDIEALVAARNREVHPLQALRHDEVVAHMTRGDVAIAVKAPTDEAVAIATATTMPRDWMGVANGALAVLVHPLHRGRGIGSALLRALNERLSPARCSGSWGRHTVRIEPRSYGRSSVAISLLGSQRGLSWIWHVRPSRLELRQSQRRSCLYRC